MLTVKITDAHFFFHPPQVDMMFLQLRLSVFPVALSVLHLLACSLSLLLQLKAEGLHLLLRGHFESFILSKDRSDKC